jgi:hypothetical protein
MGTKASAALAFLLLAPAAAVNSSGQTCDPNAHKAPVSIEVGDASTPPDNAVAIQVSSPGCGAQFSGTLGEQLVGFDCAGDFTIRASKNSYLLTPWVGGVSCSHDATGCLVCSGEANVSLYAALGNISGTVVEIPPITFPPGNVLATSPAYSTYAGIDAATRHYTFAA